MTNIQIEVMREEYKKGGKFKDFVDKSCKVYETTVEEAFEKVIMWEYYLSVSNTKGCNYDREIHGDKD